jgi:hypothetical protein
MKLQVAFVVRGFLGFLDHTIEIDDKDGYDIKKITKILTKILTKTLKQAAVEKGTPWKTYKVERILYSVQV